MLINPERDRPELTEGLIWLAGFEGKLALITGGSSGTVEADGKPSQDPALAELRTYRVF